MNEQMKQCLALAATQHGVFTRTQAAQAGVKPGKIDWRVAEGLWVRKFSGVYALSGTADSWHQRLMAAVLWAGEPAAASHHAAAKLHGFPRFEEERVEVTCTSDRRAPTEEVRIGERVLRRPLLAVHCSRSLPPADVTPVASIPTTTPTRTLIDLSASVDAQTLRSSFDHAIGKHLTSLARMENVLLRLRKGRDLRQLDRILDRYRGGEPPTESELEAKAFDLLERGRLPRPQKQVAFKAGRCVRVDFIYPCQRVVLEIDGWVAHHTPEKREADAKRRNALMTRGLWPYVWTWRAMRDDPQGCIDEVAAKLRATSTAEQRR